MTTSVIDPLLETFSSEIGESGPVSVAGSRTRWMHGGALEPGTRVVAAPTGIVAYHPEEMTVRVRAGTAVSALHDELAARGQRSALPDRGGSVGGALAVGENDLCVLGRGRVRDALLQVRYVDDAGVLVTAGGAVVKNVSGFNLPKLMVGALGTLGLIGEVVLRTNPLPDAALWLRSDSVDPREVLATLFRPSVVLWDGTHTWVQLEGHRADVLAERAVLGAIGRFDEADGPPSLPPHRWSLRPADVAALDTRQMGGFVASVGVGSVWAERPQPPAMADSASMTVATRLKARFDPTGRLNPGRKPGA